MQTSHPLRFPKEKGILPRFTACKSALQISDLPVTIVQVSSLKPILSWLHFLLINRCRCRYFLLVLLFWRTLTATASYSDMCAYGPSSVPGRYQDSSVKLSLVEERPSITPPPQGSAFSAVEGNMLYGGYKVRSSLTCKGAEDLFSVHNCLKLRDDNERGW